MSAAFESCPSPVPTHVPLNPHLLVVLNPGSNRYNAADLQAKQYFAQGFACEKTDLVLTERDRALTEEKIYDKLEDIRQPYDAVACLTGDGGANPVARRLLGTTIPLYLGGYGGINDGHLTTVGSTEQGLIAGQPIVPVFPLETVIQSGDKKVKEIALFYQGIGYTALAAEFVNGPKHRKSFLMHTRPTKKLREGMTVGKAWLLNQAFEVKDLYNGEISSHHEYLLSKGPRMAGMAIYPGDPRSPDFYKLAVHWKVGAIAELFKLAILRDKANWQQAGYMAIRVTTKKEGQTIPFQFDGETLRLESGTMVHTRTSAEPLFVVAPALAA